MRHSVARISAATVLIAALTLSATAEPSLQERIDAAVTGSILVVEPGHYPGNISIDKPLVLRGKGLPHIEGDSQGKTIQILAPDVTIDGFRISHSGLNLSRDDAAIHIQADGAVITNNHIHDCLHGIYVRGVNGARVSNNRIHGIEETSIAKLGPPVPGATDSALCSVNQDRRGNGLHFWNSRDHVIVGNEISGTRDGIYFSFTRESRIERNHVYRTRYGLHYMYSDENYFSNNRFENNVAGAALMFSKGVAVHGNSFVNNRGPRAYGLLLHNVDGSTIWNNRMEGNSTGIYLQDSHVNQTRNNRIVHNFVGMRLTSSSTSNVFQRNQFGLNLHNIDLAGRNNQNRWNEDGTGNYWPGATTLDLDGDGASEIPHRETDLFGRARDDFPLISLLTESPGLKALQFALQRSPIPKTHYITDEHPLTQPPE